MSKKMTKQNEPGAEAYINQMDEYSRYEMGRKTYRFVESIRASNPSLWAEIQRRAMEGRRGE